MGELGGKTDGTTDHVELQPLGNSGHCSEVFTSPEVEPNRTLSIMIVDCEETPRKCPVSHWVRDYAKEVCQIKKCGGGFERPESNSFLGNFFATFLPKKHHHCYKCGRLICAKCATKKTEY